MSDFGLGSSTVIQALIPKLVAAQDKMLISQIQTSPLLNFKDGIASREGNVNGGMICVKTEYLKAKMNKITFGIVLIDDSSGVYRDDNLRGKEQKQVTADYTLNVWQIRHGYTNIGEDDDMKAQIKLMALAMMTNIAWLTKRMHKEFFYQASGLQGPDVFANTPTAPTTNRIVYAGTATALNNITTSDILSLDTLKKMRAKAHKFIAEDKENGIDQVNAIEPLGGEWNKKGKFPYTYIVFVSDEQLVDLQKDDENQALQSRSGKGNYYFTGQELEYLGMLIVPTSYIPGQLGGVGGNLNVHRAILCGKNAVAYGIGKKTKFPTDNWDYQNQIGKAIAAFCGMGKVKFTGLDDQGVLVADSYVELL